MKEIGTHTPAGPSEAHEPTLLKLAERCEREEPSWELECAIAEAVGWYTPHPDYRRPKSSTPTYCNSIDAAVGLVPEDCVWGVDNFAGATARVIGGDIMNGWDVYSDVGTTKTAAMALCAAALKARAEIGKSDRPEETT